MAKLHMLLIYNPKAGKGLFLQSLGETIDKFVKAGYKVEVYPTQGVGDATRKIARVPGYIDLIVAAGGDGTLDEVITGIVLSGRDVPIGYIPVGSTNDYAASLSVPTTIPEAVDCILHGSPQAVDMGAFNDDTFVYVAAFGAFTDVAYDTNQDMKNALGHLAYIIEGAKRLGDLKPYHMRIHVDGIDREASYIYGMVTNSTSVGGIKGATGPDVYLDDGKFEVLLIHMPKNLMELSEIGQALISNDLTGTDLVEYYKTERITFASEVPVPWTLDGEYGGNPEFVRIGVRHQCVRLVLAGEHNDVLGGWRNLKHPEEDDHVSQEEDIFLPLKQWTEELRKSLGLDE